jgi:hypothetical protein
MPANSPPASASHAQRFIYNNSAQSSNPTLLFTAQHNTTRHDMQLYTITIDHTPSSSVHAHTHMYTSASVFSCIELARLLPHSSAARAEASHIKLPQHASTGSQSSTLKSTRSTFQSPDRLWGLSTLDPPLHLAFVLNFSTV